MSNHAPRRFTERRAMVAERSKLRADIARAERVLASLYERLNYLENELAHDQSACP